MGFVSFDKNLDGHQTCERPRNFLRKLHGETTSKTHTYLKCDRFFAGTVHINFDAYALH